MWVADVRPSLGWPDDAARAWHARREEDSRTDNEAIRIYDRLLLILSPESMASEWVATEIAKARKKEAAQDRRVLFPISIVPYSSLQEWELFDADRGKDSAREIRQYFIPDLSTWKDHDAYTKAFETLLKALQSEDLTYWSAAPREGAAPAPLKLHRLQAHPPIPLSHRCVRED